MTTVIKITAAQLPALLQQEVERMPKLIKRAARAAVMRLKSYMVARVNALKISDLGTYKRSFVTDENSLTNVAPHAGIVEEGARPHKVSKEGIEAIAKWVRRKLRKTTYSLKQKRDAQGRFAQGDEVIEKKRRYRRSRTVYTVVDLRDQRGRFTGDADVVAEKRGKDEALEIAYAIAKTIEKFGQKGRYVMRDALPMARLFFEEELTRLLVRHETGIKL